MAFSGITVRSNGQKILHSWFNALRTAGINLETWLGGGFIVETTFTFANNQVAAADVTGALFSSASYKSALVTVAYRRSTSSARTFGVADIYLYYRDNTAAWDLDVVEHGDASGLTFSITAAGQLQYTSDSMSGTSYSGASRFKATTFGT